MLDNVQQDPNSKSSKLCQDIFAAFGEKMAKIDRKKTKRSKFLLTLDIFSHFSQRLFRERC